MYGQLLKLKSHDNMQMKIYKKNVKFIMKIVSTKLIKHAKISDKCTLHPFYLRNINPTCFGINGHYQR